MSNRLIVLYKTKVQQELALELGVKNLMAVPRIGKVVINAGVGELAKSKDSFEKFKNELTAITGQSVSVRPAKISVAGFNVRAGSPVGVAGTLRGVRMYDFLDKLISVVLPRLRDFRGVSSSSFDKSGNYSLGMADHTVFPEVDAVKVEKARHLEITIVIKNGSPDKSKRLLELMGVPFEIL